MIMLLSSSPGKIRFMRTTFLRIAAAALILLGLGTVIIYMANSGISKQEILQLLPEMIRKMYWFPSRMEVRFI